jgi:uncharacterized membrane protein
MAGTAPSCALVTSDICMGEPSNSRNPSVSKDRMRRHWLARLWHSFSTAGLLLGALFFAFSLTPSLLPRTYLTQDVLAGCSLAAGYFVGVFGYWLWSYTELPMSQGRVPVAAVIALA